MQIAVKDCNPPSGKPAIPILTTSAPSVGGGQQAVAAHPAAIPKVDERGRTVDVHALRHTFGTLLSKSGVAPRTAQAAMRHSTINLTMNTYTDPKLLDLVGAVEALPALPLDGACEVHTAKATGTNDSRALEFAPKFAPGFAPTVGKSAPLGSIPDKRASWEDTPARGQETQETLGKPGASRQFSQWAAPDSNWRLLPCEDSALTN
jgi:hypothetical protein